MTKKEEKKEAPVVEVAKEDKKPVNVVINNNIIK